MHEAVCDFLLDIIQNAIEADADDITIDMIIDDERVSCRVADDGKGMSETELERVRDPFFTDGVKHTSRKIGLGIPFLEQAVNMTGGEFLIESEKGRGTVLEFSFPKDHIDTPPVGDVPMTFFAALTYPGSFDMHIAYRREHAGEHDGYELHKSELIEILGDLTYSDSLILLKEFIASQDEYLEIRG